MEKIMVMGAGALGSLFGGLVANAGYDVTLVAREWHVAAIRKHGLRISGLTEITVDVKAVTSPEAAEPPDIVLFTVKSYDTETAAKQLKPCIHEETAVVSLQNGLGNEERLSEILGAEHVLGGVTSYGALLKEPGHVAHTGVGDTFIGELDGEISKRALRICEILNDGGIKAEAVADVRKKIWEKLIVNAAINPITAIARVRNEGLLHGELRWLMEATAREAASVARCAGVNIDVEAAVKKAVEVATKTGKNESSMLQDIKRGKRTEIDAISGEIVKLAEKFGIEAPINKTLHALVKNMKYQA